MDLNIKLKTIKLLEENIGEGEKIHEIWFDSDFLDMTLKGQAITTTKYKLDYIKI